MNADLIAIASVLVFTAICMIGMNFKQMVKNKLKELTGKSGQPLVFKQSYIEELAKQLKEVQLPMLPAPHPKYMRGHDPAKRLAVIGSDTVEGVIRYPIINYRASETGLEDELRTVPRIPIGATDMLAMRIYDVLVTEADIDRVVAVLLATKIADVAVAWKQG